MIWLNKQTKKPHKHLLLLLLFPEVTWRHQSPEATWSWADYKPAHVHIYTFWCRSVVNPPESSRTVNRGRIINDQRVEKLQRASALAYVEDSLWSCKDIYKSYQSICRFPLQQFNFLWLKDETKGEGGGSKGKTRACLQLYCSWRKGALWNVFNRWV